MLTDAEWERVARYAMGEYLPEAEAHERSWVDENLERQALARELNTLRAASIPPEDTWGAEHGWKRLIRETPGLKAEPDASKDKPSQRRLRWSGGVAQVIGCNPLTVFKWGGAVTACAALILGVRLVAVVQRGAYGHSGAALEYVTDVGEHRTFSLVDGTQVTLGPASHVWVARDYGRRARTVELEGEAFFTVVHNEAHPFLVRTQQAVVRDVGTAFDLKAYVEDQQATVAVTEGAVSVSTVRCSTHGDPSGCAAALTQGDVALLDGDGVTVKHSGDLDQYTAWMQDRLAFDRTPLREVARDLERTFNLQITIADTAVARRLITGNFAQVPVDQILDEITRTLGVRFEHHGRMVVISERLSDSPGRESHSPLPLSTAFKSTP